MKLKILLLVLFALVMVDGVITNYMTNNNLATEANPLLAGIAGSGSLLAVKAVGGLIAVWLLWRRSKKKYVSSLWATVVFVFIYSGIVGWNAYWCV